MAMFGRVPLTGSSNAGGVLKIAIFDNYLVLSRKWSSNDKDMAKLTIELQEFIMDLLNGAVINDLE